MVSSLEEAVLQVALHIDACLTVPGLLQLRM